MRIARRTMITAGAAAALAGLGLTAALAASPAAPPPRIAFLANGRVAADALAAGPIAGQLGAPIYTTEKAALSPEARDGLTAYDPELVIVLGGPAAITDDVVDQVVAATGLVRTDADAPTDGVVRAAGGTRFATAAVVADLLGDYDSAFVSVAGTLDADTLGGKAASAFQPAGDYLPADGKAVDAAHADTADTAGDADLLDGKDSTEFVAASSPLEPVAIFNVNDGGWINTQEHRAPITDDLTSTQLSSDAYEITLPGAGYDWLTDVATCTAIHYQNVTLVTGEYDDKLRVEAYDDIGNPVSTEFACVLYKLS